MKDKLTLLLIVNILFVVQLLAQDSEDIQKAIELKEQAIELMDNGQFEESLKLLDEAEAIDPGNIHIPYEKAFAYQLAGDYDKSLEISKRLLKHPDVFDMVYQMVGNVYDYKGDKNKAIKYYDKGIKLFPNSGKLYLEKGIVLSSQEKWFEALESWEQGIIADPTHSSNYYYASQILSQTDEKIWGIYYGEIFLNLESNTARTAQISELLFNTYKTCLPTVNNKWGLEFSRKATNIVIGDLKNLKFSFETVHNLVMEQGYKGVEPEFTVDNLITIRKQFLEKWNEDYADRYPNLIFDYHAYLNNANMLESYFYWLLKDGAEEEFNTWKENNPEALENFILWKNENPMTFSDSNKTNRFSYD